MAQMLEAQLQAKQPAARTEAPVAATPDDIRVQELVRGVNAKSAERAATNQPLEIAEPVAVESGEAKVEQADAEKEGGERDAEYAALLRANALKAEKRKRDEQAEIAAARKNLFVLPSARSMTPLAESAERAPKPLPKVDAGRIYQTKFGPLMLLSISDENSEEPPTMYFASPEERRRVDDVMRADRSQSQSSLDVANFQHVVALTPDQVRKFTEIADKQENTDVRLPERSEGSPVEAPNAIKNRYSRIAA